MGQPEKTKQSGDVASRRVVARCNGAIVIWIVKFLKEGYKIKKDFRQKSLLSKETIFFCELT